MYPSDELNKIEILLTAIGVKSAIAAALLERFGSLKTILESRPESLQAVDGIGPVAAMKIVSMLDIFRSYTAELETPSNKISTRKELVAFCKSLVMGKRCKEVWVICVDKQCRVVGVRRITTGSVDDASCYPRLVASAVLDFNACNAFLCSNDPAGEARPSTAAIYYTQRIKDLLRSIGVNLLDHLIVSADKTYSMADLG